MTNFKKLRQMIDVQGNAQVVTKEFTVSSFIRLHVACHGATELIQSDEEKVVVETDENLMDYFSATNAGRTLYVGTEAKLRKPAFSHLRVKVYLRQIDVLYVRCDKGDVVCGNTLKLRKGLEVKIQSVGNTSLDVEAPEIKILSQCDGDVKLKGSCNQLRIKNQSHGNLDAREMIAQVATITNMANGDVSLHADQNISIRHLGNGSVLYYGNAVMDDVRQFGSGPIRHVKS